MIEYKKQLELQACLDGELPQSEAREISALVARDAEAAALFNELRQTRAAVAAGEPARSLPETREFYWSKISRQIAALEREEAAPPRVSLLARLRNWLGVTAAVAAVALVAFTALRPGAGGLLMETSLRDAGAFTYHDYPSGTTLVWLSYPAAGDNAVAENEGVATVE